MYYFVEDKQFLKRAQSDCSATIKELETLLRNNYDINSQAFLVGSGARNMITQNENEGIDFDYNLNILSCPDWDNAKSIKETVRIAFNKILRNQGSFYMVNRPERLGEIICLFNKYKIEIKKLRLVYPKINKEPNLVLIKGIKNAKPFLKVESPLIIYNEDNTYTDEILKIYNKK